VLQPKIEKKSLKTHIFGVQGHRCWYPLNLGGQTLHRCTIMQTLAIYHRAV